jgi:RNA polymerase sigma-70 factor (ECF subfamily)
MGGSVPLAASGSPPAERDLPLADRLAPEEFEAFYAEVGPRLRGFLYSQTGDGSVADDLAQEAFTRVLASRLRPESTEHLVRYLYKTAVHLLRDRGRAAGRQPLPLLVEHDSPQPAPPVELRRDLARALAALGTRERRLLWMAHVEGMKHDAIADALGARSASIRVMLFRARRRLAMLLGREDAGEGRIG